MKSSEKKSKILINHRWEIGSGVYFLSEWEGFLHVSVYNNNNNISELTKSPKIKHFMKLHFKCCQLEHKNKNAGNEPYFFFFIESNGVVLLHQ